MMVLVQTHPKKNLRSKYHGKIGVTNLIITARERTRTTVAMVGPKTDTKAYVGSVLKHGTAKRERGGGERERSR